MAIFVALAGPVFAKDIRLGGTSASPTAPPPKLAPNIIELPTIEVSIRKEDGGWRHIRIDAWLAPKQVAIARDMDGMKTSIVKHAREELPGNRGFDALRSAHEGNQVAKEVLHHAAERSLGHPWDGDVLIRNILVY
ncbi:hypothetical protein [Telmatospirillum sp.]|uniref:hypothetical protein n=1 Tax=Telmatospirillum sp. TaxID=2079197 RepID=UPI00284ECED8|nr:hypothetical protein [Telmatospirillum sp.]MDR3441066.1 hypothetical protein [Telmatospirillum sp.]